MMKKLLYALPILLLSNAARAAYGLEQIGQALITFSILIFAIPFVVGGVALLVVKKRKGRAFLIGFGISAAILGIWLLISS